MTQYFMSLLRKTLVSSYHILDVSLIPCMCYRLWKTGKYENEATSNACVIDVRNLKIKKLK